MSVIDQAFGRNDGLRQKIYNVIKSAPAQRPLFEEIASYHLRHSLPVANGISEADGAEEPAAKKRKLANGALPIHGADAKAAQILEVKDVSFSIPQRKKLHFRIAQYSAPDQTTIGVQAINPTSGQVEYELPGSEIANVLCLPVPEKASKQFNYIFLPNAASTFEPVLFTLPATPLKPGTFTLPSSATTLDEALNHILPSHNLSLTLPNADEFASATPEPHRKSEKAYHVKAFRGSKDGYLFFLSTGLFFGYKKPLLFLSFSDIESISYTSVLQRTFNLNVAYQKPGADEGDAEEIEFSMLDQGDFQGINEYVQRHGLNDASLAAGRRAKSETKKKGAAAANGEMADAEREDDDGRTELEKAEQMLQDEEDEDEEDFEPSDGDDEDEGSGSEDDSDEDDEPKAKKDLVQDELGSEAEDVEISDEEDDDGDDDDEDDAPKGDIPPAKAVTQQPKIAAPMQPAARGGWGVPDPYDEDQL
ncbi:uncharacterized protein HMPREF1541_01669 [Cyphellophora europaea CBS 101466]|uniref:Histone chaperone RTT106/FACT complex subunit SPT16-like middle domain-containing protein n=1 Tax=Cyphellophora europaea (strain CBS 101466) TaxID=1220924 RepID=W2S1F5_CYPE1|nr:uncharacterized protein HMPREF1541_01669 [Cyphellophora europaea CBS 101466]ETN42512.1 hypothetical protein HMPREF1541_01669 [Cyphellophora europaea CBS 101466]